MAITAKDVQELRKATGAGMMDAKKALTEADGDFEAAVHLSQGDSYLLSITVFDGIGDEVGQRGVHFVFEAINHQAVVRFDDHGGGVAVAFHLTSDLRSGRAAKRGEEHAVQCSGR